jgi:hypothetical protein
MDNFLTNQWRQAHAGKRVTGRDLFSIDAPSAEARYRAEPFTAEAPELPCDRPGPGRCSTRP